ncbi:MAG: tetratricopeptide repeat protein, partial [Bacteroidota bacterium]
LEILKTGFEKYPNSNELLVDFINYYLVKGESEKALGKLEKGIKENPENQTYHYAMGTLYDTMNKDTTGKYTAKEKIEYEGLAISAYKKAVELKGEYFDALFNLGVVYYNRAANIIKKAQNIPPKEQKRYNAEIEKANKNFKLALPYMKKAHEVNIRDRSALTTLSTIYLKLQMYDEQKEVKEMLDNLPAEQ